MTEHTTIHPSTKAHSNLPIIRIVTFQHRQDLQLGLHFTYNTHLKNHLLKFDGMRWTKTHRCFYIKDEDQAIEKLQVHCRGVARLVMPPTGKDEIKPEIRSRIGEEIKSRIRSFEEWMEQKRYQETTIRTYISFVINFFSYHPTLSWNGLTREIIEQYNHSHFITKRQSYSTQNQWINAIKLYLKAHQLDLGELSTIERPRKHQHLPDVLSPEEVREIIMKTPNLKHRTLLMLIYSSGLRIGETLDLKVTDIQKEEGLIYIRGGKGNKDRRVPLSPRILEQLRKYYQAYRPQKFLFEGQQGGRYSERSAAQVLKRAVKATGISKRVTLHTLRHSYATHLTNKGVNIQYLQEILGHKSPKTTMIYTHLSGKDIRKIRSPLDDMDL